MTNSELSERLVPLVLASQRRCGRCSHGHLELLEVRPDPNFGALGVAIQTLKCQTCEAVETD